MTKPLTFAGKTLEVNYKTGEGGSVRVELQDADGRAIEGYAADRCRALEGDEIAARVTWSGGNIGKLAGKEVRIRFVVQEADVYAWRFVE